MFTRVALICVLAVASAVAGTLALAGGAADVVVRLIGIGSVTMALSSALIIAFLCGAIVTGVLVTLFLPPDPRIPFGAFVYAIVMIAFVYVLHLGGITGLPFFRSLVVVALTLGGLIAAILAGRRFTSESGLEVRTRSGGLGGGLGGWRLSPAASFALLTALLIGAAVATANIDRPPLPAKVDTPQQTGTTPRASSTVPAEVRLFIAQ